MTVLVLDLPFQDQIDRSSGTVSEGFAMTSINYGGKVTQSTFDGSDSESAREDIYKINWAFLEYHTPAEVLNGAVDQVKEVRDFYKRVHQGRIRWKPFESDSISIWEIIPNSLKLKNTAGCIFTGALRIRFLYNE